MKKVCLKTFLLVYVSCNKDYLKLFSVKIDERFLTEKKKENFCA